MRFRPEQHLRRQSDIRAVRELGRRVDCRAFTLWWKRREPTIPAPALAAGTPAEPAAGIVTLPRKPAPLPGARVCVIASGAAVGGAVRRNRAKRRLREVFRHRQDSVPAGCDLLLIARAAATTWPLHELEKRFSEACGQIAPAASEPS